MSAVEVLPDVEVDESELTQQPCSFTRWMDETPVSNCRNRAVGEDLVRCSAGHVVTKPRCEQHIGSRACVWHLCHTKQCLADAWLIASRYYTRRTQ